MPSIQSKLLSMLASRSTDAMLTNFDVDRIRKRVADLDRLVPTPRNVAISPATYELCKGEWITPKEDTDRVVLYIPGGGWALRTPNLHRRVAAGIAQAANAKVLLLFYRLAPEHPFPAGLEDCINAYNKLLKEGLSPSKIVIGGDSAGGNLTLATLLALRDNGQPLPAGAFTISACTDISSNKGGAPNDIDELLENTTLTKRDDPRLLYVGENKDLLEHPYASPVRADLSGLCPILLQVGGSELLLRQSIHFGEKARKAGVDAEVEIWEEQNHVWHSMPIPESELSFSHLGDFIRYRCESSKTRYVGEQYLQGLHSDHARFSRVLSMIGRDAHRIVSEPEAVIPVFEEAVDYIVNFQNAYHHACEEPMFAKIAEYDESVASSVKRLSREHRSTDRAGQSLLTLISRTPVEAMNRKARMDLARKFEAFARQMRKHIGQEEKLLYSQAWAKLNKLDWNEIADSSTPKDPLGEKGTEEFPLLSQYVNNVDAQSTVSLLSNSGQPSSEWLLDLTVSPRLGLKSMVTLASRQTQEAIDLAREAIDAYPRNPLLKPCISARAGFNGLTDLGSAYGRWMKEWHELIRPIEK